MSKTMRRPGEFVWREVTCRDGEAAREFYGALFGWSFQKGVFPDMPYSLIIGPSGPMGGMMEVGADAPMPPSWTAYLSVDSVDETAAGATAAGGQVMHPPTDIPGVGRFAIAADPTGAVLGVLTQANGDGPRGEQPPVGAFCWETISSTDVEKERAFYKSVIGWREVGGSAGMVVFASGEVQVCDLEPTEPGMPSFWMSHVVIEDLDASRAKMESLGGRVLAPRVDIPNVGAICIFADREGAVISMFQPGAAAPSAN